MICLKCRNTHAGLKFKQTPIIECPGCGYHEPVSAKYEGLKHSRVLIASGSQCASLKWTNFFEPWRGFDDTRKKYEL